MGLLEKVGVSVVRPFYRTFFEKPLWWFLAKVKAFFFAETSERLLRIENRLAALEKPESIEELFRRTEASNAAEWDALEQLLLALYRQPESRRPLELGKENSVSQHAAIASAAEINRVNGPHTIR